MRGAVACPPPGAYLGKCHVCGGVFTPDHLELDGGRSGRRDGRRPQLGGVRCCDFCLHFMCDSCRGDVPARTLSALANLLRPKDRCCGPDAPEVRVMVREEDDLHHP